MTGISVFGAGAFGTALAVSLARSGKPVTLVARSTEHAKEMRETRENKRRLAGITLPPNINPTTELSAEAGTVLIAIPTQQLGSTMPELRAVMANKTVVTCNKGIDLATGHGPTAVVQSIVPDIPVAALSGPGFAFDIARGLPTALTIACANAQIGQQLQLELATDNLRLYRTTDVVGVELGGAVKNVMAIAAGLVIGVGLGESARAALITRGFAELTRYAAMRNARPETLAGLSGLGDLILTCTSEQSRNYAHGLLLGSGEDPAIGKTVEGVSTARALARISIEHGLGMPITETVAGILDNKISVTEAQAALFARPMKEE